MNLTIRYLYGGEFSSKDVGRISYKKKGTLVVADVDPDLLSKMELEVMLLGGVDDIGIVKEIWYLKPGLSLTDGLNELVCDQDIRDICEGVGKDNIVHLYVIQEGETSPTQLKQLAEAHLTPTQGDGPVITQVEDHNPTSSIVVFSQQEAELLNNILPSDDDESDDEHDGDEDGDVDLSETSSDDDDDLTSDQTFVIQDVFGESNGSDDEQLFKDNVNAEVNEAAEQEEQPAAISLEEDELSGEDVFHKIHGSGGYLSYSGSEGEGGPRYPEFNPLVDFKNKIFLKPGMRFGSNEIFRKALRQYALENGFDYYYLHNDKSKVTAYCKRKCDCPYDHGRIKCACNKSSCKFKACARRMGSDGSFQLKTFVEGHECGWQDQNTKVTSIWLAEKYLETYKSDPKWRIKSFIETVKREHNVQITYSQAWKARVRAILQTQGYAPDQYARIWRYAKTILKWNPGSSAFVKVTETIGVERPLFQRFYICLDACKKGFKVGCRPIIGIDGCHLKGAYKGQMFTAVGKDGNENIFPIAYAVVELETKDTWCWFLQCLIHDIGSDNLTFMSDRQKGLVEALKEVVPTAHTRVCVRHMYNNFKQKWHGKGFKDAVWAAARASTTPDFKQCMERIKSMSEDAYKYLMKQDPQSWSLHAFHYGCKSDMQLNNGSESFNSCILEAREMPILSMCEWMRRNLMKMFVAKRATMMKHNRVITPEVVKKIEDTKRDALSRGKCYGQGDQFEVDYGSKTYVVDLGGRSCGCNMWDISGIPCVHAICCILKRRLTVAQFVDPYYTKDTYMRAYGQTVLPMPGVDQWEGADQVEPLPPEFVIQPGRPKKKRKREIGEPRVGKSKRTTFGKNKCSNCGQEGHYKNKCNNPPKPPETKSTNKGGRPPSSSTVQLHAKKRKYTKKVRTELPIGADPPYDLFGSQPEIIGSTVTQATPNVGSSEDPGRKRPNKLYPLRQRARPAWKM